MSIFPPVPFLQDSNVKQQMGGIWDWVFLALPGRAVASLCWVGHSTAGHGTAGAPARGGCRWQSICNITSCPQIITARQAGDLQSCSSLHFSISPPQEISRENKNPKPECWQAELAVLSSCPAVCNAVPSPSHRELMCQSHFDAAYVQISPLFSLHFFTLRQNLALAFAWCWALPSPSSWRVQPSAPGRLPPSLLRGDEQTAFQICRARDLDQQQKHLMQAWMHISLEHWLDPEIKESISQVSWEASMLYHLLFLS